MHGRGQAETQRDVGSKTFRRIRRGAPPGDQKREPRNEDEERSDLSKCASPHTLAPYPVPPSSPHGITCFLVPIVMPSAFVADEGVARARARATENLEPTAQDTKGNEFD